MGRPKKVGSQELLEVACEVLMRDGVPGAAKKIARKAGISEAALISRYKKTELLVAALMPPELDPTKIICGAPAQQNECQSLLADAVRMLDYFREAAPRILPLLGEPQTHRELLLGRLGQNPALRLRTALSLHLQREAKARRVSQNNAAAAATLLAFALYSAALFEAIGVQTRRFPRSELEALVNVLWQGLRPEQPKKGKSRPSRLSALQLI